MPVYVIACPDCGKEDEVFCHHSDSTKFKCESCGTNMIVKPTVANWKIKGFCAKGNYE